MAIETKLWRILLLDTSVAPEETQAIVDTGELMTYSQTGKLIDDCRNQDSKCFPIGWPLEQPMPRWLSERVNFTKPDSDEGALMLFKEVHGSLLHLTTCGKDRGLEAALHDDDLIAAPASIGRRLTLLPPPDPDFELTEEDEISWTVLKADRGKLVHLATLEKSEGFELAYLVDEVIVASVPIGRRLALLKRQPKTANLQ